MRHAMYQHVARFMGAASDKGLTSPSSAFSLCLIAVGLLLLGGNSGGLRHFG